jgi:CMP-N-acetylneuraminic acid synthetase
MANLEDISVVIPVREGSSRVRDKIYLPFGEGRNLVEWKVSQLLQVHRPDRIFLSSNAPRVAQTAKDMGVMYLQRSDYLCDGHMASFSEVITGIVSDVPTPYFAWVTVVVPLMRPAEYLDGFKSFLEHVVRRGTHDSLVTVNSLKDYLWGADAPLNYRADRHHTISQELPDTFRVTNGLYMRAREETLRDGYFLGPRPYMHTVDKLSGIDIDKQEDYEIALALKSLYDRHDEH